MEVLSRTPAQFSHIIVPAPHAIIARAYEQRSIILPSSSCKVREDRACGSGVHTSRDLPQIRHEASTDPAMILSRLPGRINSTPQHAMEGKDVHDAIHWDLRNGRCNPANSPAHVMEMRLLHVVVRMTGPSCQPILNEAIEILFPTRMGSRRWLDFGGYSGHSIDWWEGSWRDERDLRGLSPYEEDRGRIGDAVTLLSTLSEFVEGCTGFLELLVVEILGYHSLIVTTRSFVSPISLLLNRLIVSTPVSFREWIRRLREKIVKRVFGEGIIIGVTILLVLGCCFAGAVCEGCCITRVTAVAGYGLDDAVILTRSV